MNSPVCAPRPIHTDDAIVVIHDSTMEDAVPFQKKKRWK